jgi:uncharacterized alpha-E superfamily protein
MLSRVAETIYWLGRYIERAENTARIVSVNTNLMLDLPRDMTPGWEPLVSLFGCREAYFERHPEVTERRVVHFLIADQDNGGSIISSLQRARDNARTIRDTLPREAWEYLNQMYNRVENALNPSVPRHMRHDFLQDVIEGVQALTGMLAGTMNHNLAYMFLNLGRKIERADMTTRIADIRWESPLVEDVSDLRPFDDVLWMSILKTLGAYQMYRRTMQVRVTREKVLEFVFKRPDFPRSLNYCIENISYNLNRLPSNDAPIAEMAHLRKAMENAAVMDMDDEVLHAFIDRTQVWLGKLHQTIAENYFMTSSQEKAV